MVDFKEGYAGFYPSLQAAEERAAELQAEGRITKVEESQFHLGMWVVHATRLEGE